MKTLFSSVSVIFLIILLAFQSCKREKGIELGAKYAGGIIFFIDNSGQHGLVAATIDQGYYPWGCVMDSIAGANNPLVGSGFQNTFDIINYCKERDIAASICDELELNGYSDWFLPSRDELNLMYVNLKLKNIGGMKSKVKFLEYESDAYYQSSTQYDKIFPWSQNFNTGIKSPGFSKNYGGWVRAARSF